MAPVELEEEESKVKMSPPFFAYGLFENRKPNFGDSQHSKPSCNSISFKSDTSAFSDISLPSCSSFQREFFPNESPQLYSPKSFRKFQTSQKCFFNATSGFNSNRPYFCPSPYFGKPRGEHGTLRGEPKFQKNSSANIPPLMTCPIYDSPGPSWSSSYDVKPSFEQKYNKNTMNYAREQLPKFRNSTGIEMAIRHASPGCRLTEKQAKFIQTQLLGAIDNMPKQKPLPQFLKTFYDQGVVWVACADKISKEWLVLNVQKLNDTWEDLNLIVEMLKPPKKPIVYVDLLELETAFEILERLASQNEGLRTDNWIVLNRKVFFSRQRITFSIDVDSFEYLKSNGFRANWKLQTIVFKEPSKAIKSLKRKFNKGKGGRNSGF